MKTIIHLHTKDGWRLAKQEIDQRADAPNPEFETYHSTLGECTVHCSTAEREEYEQQFGASVGADVLPPDAFSALCTWLKDNAGLRLTGVYYNG